MNPFTNDTQSELLKEELEEFQKNGFSNERIQYIDATKKARRVALEQWDKKSQSGTATPEELTVAEDIVFELDKQLRDAKNPEISWEQIQEQNKTVVNNLAQDTIMEHLEENFKLVPEEVKTPQMFLNERIQFLKSQGWSEEDLQSLNEIWEQIRSLEEAQELHQKEYLRFHKPEDKLAFDSAAEQLKELREKEQVILNKYDIMLEHEETQSPKKAPSSAEEIIEDLRESNAKIADLMLEMKAEIERLTERQKHPLRSAFRDTTKAVADAVKTCDSIIKEFKKEREELRGTVEKKFGSLHSNSPETQGVINSVRDVYNSCEEDILRAIESIEQMKGHLAREVGDTTAQMKKVTVADKAKSLLKGLENKANLIRANAIDKKADKHRKHARHFSNVKSAVIEFDKFTRKYGLRLKNVLHAIKGESFEQFHYERKGLIKKLTDTLEENCKKEQKEALTYQQRADAIKAFVPEVGEKLDAREEKRRQKEEEKSGFGPLKM